MVTEEILRILADPYCPTEGLTRDDLLGSLTQPEDNANNWRNQVRQTLRTLDELEFVTVHRLPYTTTYKITYTGRIWVTARA